MTGLSGPPPTPLHPVIQAVIAKMRAAGQPALSAGTPDEARRLMAAARPGLGAGPVPRERREVTIPTRVGSIPGVLFIPEQRPVGLAVYLHGGGWVVGALEDYEVLASTLAHRSSCVVLLVGYRLAPEHPFPAGLEDTEDAFLWAWSNRSQLAGGFVPMLVAGDSAGANLATVAARRLADVLQLAGQVLIYPVAAADFTTPSYERFGVGLPLRRDDMEWFFRHYAPQELWDGPDISPLSAAGLENVPRAIVALAEHDVLHDEGESYARKLEEHGRLLALRSYEGVTHGFIRLHNLVDTADRAVSELAADINLMCQDWVRLTCEH